MLAGPGPSSMALNNSLRRSSVPAPQVSRRCKVTIVCRSSPGPSGSGDEGMTDPTSRRSKLETVIRRKQQQIEAKLKELGMEALEERLQSSVQIPAKPPYRLATLVAESVPQGKAVLVFELVRPSPSTTPQELANLAKQYVSLGADALAVRTDSDDTSTGLADLWCVTQAVKVPVVAKDWMIHPLQVVEIKEAGAAGVLGVIHQVNGRGTPVMSSFSAAIGLDAPVEVVNAQEVELLSRVGAVFYAINVSVGLSLPIPGFSQDIAHGLLGQLPFGAISIVGARTLEEARKARQSGADALLIKAELIQTYTAQDAAAAANKDPFALSGLRRLAEELKYLTAGDD